MEIQGAFHEMIAEVHGEKLPWTFCKNFKNFFSSYLTQEGLRGAASRDVVVT